METDYKVRLEVFEGPLDLLLYLIKRDEIDIYDISLKWTVDGERVLIVYDGWKPIMEEAAWSGRSWNVYGPGADEILYRHDATHGEICVIT